MRWLRHCSESHQRRDSNKKNTGPNDADWGMSPLRLSALFVASGNKKGHAMRSLKIDASDATGGAKPHLILLNRQK